MPLDSARHLQLADDLLRRFASALRGAQLYAPSHPLVMRNITALSDTVGAMHGFQPTVTIGLVGDEVVIDDVPLPKAAGLMGELIGRLRSRGVERISIERGVPLDEIIVFVHTLAKTTPASARPVDGAERARGSAARSEVEEFPDLAHIRVGRIQVEDRVENDVADMATVRRLYSDAVSAAGVIWEGTLSEGTVDPAALRTIAQGLAQAVAQNRTALLALTALKNYDNYTFTHMVNVSILTMAQARGLGVDGPVLREFGVAGLMHDIGKVRTPLEILNKPDRLSPAEYEVIKRHPVDGAELLRRTPEIPPLVPVVAFEHHLRLDGTGYPAGAARDMLNVGTMLASIADVFDAMRSQRRYQQAFPSDRILAVLEGNDGHRFDKNLVRRFVQLIGIYPPGNVVRLDNGEIAVVLRVHAADPHRPKVRVLFTKDGKRLDAPRDVNLWQTNRADGPTAIVAPVDAEDYGIDPLGCI